MNGVFKYVLYFHFYALSYDSCENKVSTVIGIKKDSVMFYMMDIGYVTWRMETIEMEQSLSESSSYYRPSSLRAIYTVSLGELRGVIYIKEGCAEIVLFTGGRPITINLRR